MTTLTELTGKPYLSYSSLNTYLSCGEKYRLTKIESIPQKPAFWLAGGTAVHTGTEVYDLCRVVDGTSHDEAVKAALNGFTHKFNTELAQHPDEEWSVGGRATKANPDRENEAWWRENGPLQVENYALWRQANPQFTIWEGPEGPAIEYPFTTSFAGEDTPSHGFIDRIFQDQGSNLYVVDIKSGTRQPADVTQLAVYATAIEHTTGIRPQFGSYYMTRTAYLTAPMDLNRWNADMLGPWFRIAKEGIEAGRFLPRLSMDCGFCSVQSFCYAKNPDVSIPTNINISQTISGGHNG
jgi:hypothetical protein